ncbi:hypothetical protein K8T06_17650 [bacterium]|nr:hypothetical protein [bacterium]
MKTTNLVVLSILLTCLVACQQQEITPVIEMDGQWIDLGSSNQREIKCLKAVSEKNIVLAGCVPEEAQKGIQVFNLSNKSWTTAPEDIPVNCMYPNIYEYGSMLFAVQFATEQDSGMIWVSNDLGETWQNSITIPENADPRCLKHCGENNGTLLLGTVSSGIFLSLDNGVTWNLPDTPTNDSGIQTFAVDAGNPNHILTGTRKNICESNDGGKNWHPITANITESEIFIVDIVAHPRKSGNFICIYRISGKASLILTTDAGQTWKPIQNGLFDDSQPRCIEFHHSDDSIIYMGTVYDGIYQSKDFGELWSPINNGLPMDKPIIIHCLEIVPGSPSNLLAGSNVNGTLYQLEIK